MKAILFDMYGVIIKSPEGDLIPFINKYFPYATAEYINNLLKKNSRFIGKKQKS